MRIPEFFAESIGGKMKIASFVIGLIFSVELFCLGILFLFLNDSVLSGASTVLVYLSSFSLFFGVLSFFSVLYSYRNPIGGGVLILVCAILEALLSFNLYTLTAIIMLCISAILALVVGKKEKKEKEEKEFEILYQKSKVYDLNLEKKEERPRGNYKNKEEEIRDLKIKIKFDLKKRNLFDEEMEEYYSNMSDRGFLKEAYRLYVQTIFDLPEEENREINLIVQEIRKYV